MNCVFSSKVRRLSKPDRLSAETFVRKFGQKNHLRVFGRDSVKLLEEAGFVVSVIDGDTMPAEIVPVVGPADYDSNKLFVGEKGEGKRG